MVVEQDGPYGSDALVDSRLPRALGEHLRSTKSGSRTGVLLARRPESRHSEPSGQLPEHKLWLATCGPGATRMRVAGVRSLADVPRLDLAQIGGGTLPGIGKISKSPALFVCTNGRRDVCCALKGREVVSSFPGSSAEAQYVWESSHQGGHRFAPVAVLLPYGYVYGRLTPETANEVVAAALRGEVTTAALRGRSSLPRTAQAAEVIVRRSYGIVGAEDLDVLARDDRGRVYSFGPSADIGPRLLQVRHVDGRAWNAEAQLEPLRPRTPESCQTEPSERTSVRIVRLEETAAWR